MTRFSNDFTPTKRANIGMMQQVFFEHETCQMILPHQAHQHCHTSLFLIAQQLFFECDYADVKAAHECLQI